LRTAANCGRGKGRRGRGEKKEKGNSFPKPNYEFIVDLLGRMQKEKARIGKKGKRKEEKRERKVKREGEKAGRVLRWTLKRVLQEFPTGHQTVKNDRKGKEGGEEGKRKKSNWSHNPLFLFNFNLSSVGRLSR